MEEYWTHWSFKKIKQQHLNHSKLHFKSSIILSDSFVKILEGNSDSHEIYVNADVSS